MSGLGPTPGVQAPGFSAGAVFPGSPALNEMFFHTGRKILYFWNGTRWLSVNLFETPIGTQEVLASQTATTVGDVARIANAWSDVYDMWLESVAFNGFVAGAGSWTMNAYSKTGSGANALLATSGAFITANTNETRIVAVGALAAKTIDSFNYSYVENSGTVGFTGSATLIYRLVG